MKASMRGGTRRRAVITSLVTALVTLAAAVGAMLAGTAPAYAAGTSQQVWLTFYGWYDNTPPGCSTASGGCAGGTGTYSDPITFATDKSEAPTGTIIWVPRVGKYFVMADDCTECDQDWSGQGPDGGPKMWHFDLWLGGQGGNAFDAIDCEDALTLSDAQGDPQDDSIIINPPSNEPVTSEPIFNTSTNACYGGAQPTSDVGTYKNTSTGQCMQVSGSSLTTAACSSAATEQLSFNGAFMIYDNQCVDNKSGSTLVFDTCTGGPTQQWSVNPNGTIEDIQTSTKCFRASGTSVVAGSCSGTASQWTFSGTTTTPPPSSGAPTTAPPTTKPPTSAPPTTTPPTTAPPTTAPPGGGKVYEADKATIGGSADANSCTACLDGQKVSAIGGSGKGTVTFTGISEPSAGTYTMTVYYLSVGKARPAVITVNGTTQTVTFAESSSSSYSVIDTATVKVSLKAGSSNTIEFSGSGTTGAPDLDHIVV